MRFAPPGLCLNDFSILSHRDGWSILHLQGPPVHPFDAGAWETSYGRAMSTDLLQWQPAGPVFGVGMPGAFDDSAVWTMSHVAIDGGLAMYYTGVTTKADAMSTNGSAAAYQSIGLAYSDRDDGTRWHRTSAQPIVTADSRWYRTDAGMAWRDPFVVYDSHDIGGWVMLVCASAADLPVGRGGCVGWAMSEDGEAWRVQPPLLVPGDIDEMECPILEKDEFGWLLLASVGATHSIHAWRAEHLPGPWEPLGRIAPIGAYAPRLTDALGTRAMLHTEQRRADLLDTGAACRGVLAQPKRCLAHPTRGVSLHWWPALDDQLKDDLDHLPHGEGVVRLSVDEPQSIDLVMAGEQSVRVHYDLDQVTLGYVEGPPLYRERILTPLRCQLTVMRHGEFVEVYLDSEWVLTGTIYSGPTPRVTATVDGRTETSQCYTLVSNQDRRDDVSATGYAKHIQTTRAAIGRTLAAREP